MASKLATIKVDVEKFLKGTGTDAEKFAVAFEKLFAKSPAAIQTVENFVNEVAPVVVVATTLAAPLAEPEVNAALGVVETGLAALEAAAQAANSGTSLVAALQNFAKTVPALLTGVAIKDPALQATITKIVNLVVGEAAVLIPAAEAWSAQLKAATK